MLDAFLEILKWIFYTGLGIFTLITLFLAPFLYREYKVNGFTPNKEED